MKKIAVVISVALNVSFAGAALITDDFNRANTALTSTGAMVGSNWHSSRTTGGWGITDQKAVASMTEANSVLYNSSLETISGNGTSFTLSLDVTAFGPYWAGIAFNYQDPENFYWLRYKGDANNFSLVRFIDGTSQSIVNSTITGTFAADTAYTLTVSSSSAYKFVYEIKEAVGGAVQVSGTATDSDSAFTGGYAGIYQSTTGPGRNTFDNFSLNVIPEPATIGMLGFALVSMLVVRRLRQ